MPLTANQIEAAEDAVQALLGSVWGTAAMLAGKDADDEAALAMCLSGMAESMRLHRELRADPSLEGVRRYFIAACRTALNVLENPQCA